MCCLILHSKYNFFKSNAYIFINFSGYLEPHIQFPRNIALTWPRNPQNCTGSGVCTLSSLSVSWAVERHLLAGYRAGLFLHPQVHQTVIFRTLNFHSVQESL